MKRFTGSESACFQWGRLVFVWHGSQSFCFRATLKFPSKLCSIPLSSTWLETDWKASNQWQATPIFPSKTSHVWVKHLTLPVTHSFYLFSRCYKGFAFLTKLQWSNFQSTDVCHCSRTRIQSTCQLCYLLSSSGSLTNGPTNILK